MTPLHEPPMRVLVVDDEEDIRTLVRVALVTDGRVTVSEARDGPDAIVQWRRHLPNVVILDHLLPGLTGIEIARLILRERCTQAIILFTACSVDGVREEALAAGIRVCLSKADLWHLPQLVRRLA